MPAPFYLLPLLLKPLFCSIAPQTPTRRDIEEQTGTPVVSPDNYLDLTKKPGQVEQKKTKRLKPSSPTPSEVEEGSE